MTVKVGVIGYGTIGSRLAYAASLQKDMELAGVADVAPTLTLRALRARGMPYKLYCIDKQKIKNFEDAAIPVSGTLEDLLGEVDIVLDAAPGESALRTSNSMRNTIFQRFSKPEKRGTSRTSSFMVTRTMKKAWARNTCS